MDHSGRPIGGLIPATDSRQMQISAAVESIGPGIPACREKRRAEWVDFPCGGMEGHAQPIRLVDTCVTRECRANNSRSGGLADLLARLTVASALGTVRGTPMSTYFYFRSPA
jgi:hypothetical protein